MFDGLFDFIGGGVFAIFAIIVVVVLIVSYIGSRYKVAAANEALVVSGQRDKSPDGRRNLKVVRGGGVIVLPLVHKVGKLKLTARQINVNLADAVTRQGIKVAVQGVATFKIGADDESIRNAAERFLESQEEAVDSIVKNVLEGSLRSIVGTLTVEELNLDRMKFQQAVQDAAKGDLATSGLQIDSFTIQAIRDESGYMELIGQQETARRERDARMAKASADQEAAVREAEAEQVKINASRDVALRRAETETQTAAAEARAAQAGPLAEAEATQEVTRKQTELAQLEAARKEQELVATTVRPAEADAAAQIRRAEGAKGAAIAQAQGDAERVKLAGEAQARVVEVTAEAVAKQTTLEGNAEAGIVLSKGEAEAKALALRADAYRQFNEAAIIQTVLSQLPDIVRAAAEPMGNIDHLTVLSNDGASDMVKNVTRTVTEAGATVKGLTGIDIPGDAQPGDGWRREQLVVRIRWLEDAPAERAEERRIREYDVNDRRGRLGERRIDHRGCRDERRKRIDDQRGTERRRHADPDADLGRDRRRASARPNRWTRRSPTPSAPSVRPRHPPSRAPTRRPGPLDRPLRGSPGKRPSTTPRPDWRPTFAPCRASSASPRSVSGSSSDPVRGRSARCGGSHGSSSMSASDS